MSLHRILRNCNLTGDLPDDLGKMTEMKVLLVFAFFSDTQQGNTIYFFSYFLSCELSCRDLSFNKLNGTIPDSFVGLIDVDFM